MVGELRGLMVGALRRVACYPPSMPAHPPTPTANTLHPVVQTAATMHPSAQTAATMHPSGDGGAPPVGVAPVLNTPTIDDVTPGVGVAVNGSHSYSVAGTPTVVETLAWYREGTPIGGEVSSTYTPTPSDVGSRLRYRVHASGPGGSDTKFSAYTTAVPGLTARRTSTNVLTDATAPGTPIAPASGDFYTQFAIDSFAAVTDAVGPLRPYDAVAAAPLGTVTGLPSVLRRSGLESTNTTDYIEFGAGVLHPTDTSTRTIMVRCRRPNSAFQRVLFEHGTNGVMLKQSGSNVILDVWTAGVRTGGTIVIPSAGSQGDWHRFAVTMTSTGNVVRQYLDTGAPVTSGSSAVAASSYGALRVGTYSTGPPSPGPWGEVGWITVHEGLSTGATIDALMLAATDSVPPAGATKAITGLVSGVYDAANPTKLLRDLTGGITAEYP